MISLSETTLPLDLTSAGELKSNLVASASSPALVFTVYGNPAPQGSKKGFAVNGRVVMTESSKRVKPWRQDVAAEAVKAIGDDLPLFASRVPLRLEVTFTMPKPASAPKRRTTFPVSKPDGDKLLRAVCDAMTGCVYVDDAQILEYAVAKRYPGEGDGALPIPGARIRVAVIA